MATVDFLVVSKCLLKKSEIAGNSHPQLSILIKTDHAMHAF